MIKIQTAIPFGAGSKRATISAHSAKHTSVSREIDERLPQYRRPRFPESAPHSTINVKSCLDALFIELGAQVSLPVPPAGCHPATDIGWDLPAAVAALAATGRISQPPEGHIFFGWMNNAKLRSTPGVACVARGMVPGEHLHVSMEDARVAQLHAPDGVTVLGYPTIRDLAHGLARLVAPCPMFTPRRSDPIEATQLDAETIRRLMIMAIGEHHGIITRRKMPRLSHETANNIIIRALGSMLHPDEDIVREALAVYDLTGSRTWPPISHPRLDIRDERRTRLYMEAVRAHGGMMFLDDITCASRDALRTLTWARDRGHTGPYDHPSLWPTRFVMLASEVGPDSSTAADQHAEIVSHIKSSGRDYVPDHLENRGARIGFDVELHVDLTHENRHGLTTQDIHREISRAIDFRISTRKQKKPNAQLTADDLAGMFDHRRLGIEWLFAAPFDNLTVRCRLLRVARTLADMDGVKVARVEHVDAARQIVFERAPVSWR